MDDDAALIARRVAMAAAAWLNAPADVEAYRRLAAAVQEWNLERVEFVGVYVAHQMSPSQFCGSTLLRVVQVWNV